MVDFYTPKAKFVLYKLDTVDVLITK